MTGENVTKPMDISPDTRVSLARTRSRTSPFISRVPTLRRHTSPYNYEYRPRDVTGVNRELDDSSQEYVYENGTTILDLMHPHHAW